MCENINKPVLCYFCRVFEFRDSVKEAPKDTHLFESSLQLPSSFQPARSPLSSWTPFAGFIAEISSPSRLISTFRILELTEPLTRLMPVVSTLSLAQTRPHRSTSEDSGRRRLTLSSSISSVSSGMAQSGPPYFLTRIELELVSLSPPRMAHGVELAGLHELRVGVVRPRPRTSLTASMSSFPFLTKSLRSQLAVTTGIVSSLSDQRKFS